MRVAILDCYVDEPACLGVPPYMSPYPRYMAGAVEDAGSQWTYSTIDDMRSGTERSSTIQGADLLVVLGGAVVPGKYLRSMPASMGEMERIARTASAVKVLGGPLARFGLDKGRLSRHFDHLSTGDVDALVHDLLTGTYSGPRARSMDEWDRWAEMGAAAAACHPDHPEPLMAEIETYRGCVRYRSGGCSFCTEPLYGKPIFREQSAIAREVGALASQGVRNFSLGGQSCFYSYKASGVGDTETPTPSPAEVGSLLSSVRKAAPGLRVLHLDNANPAVIASHPEEAAEVTRLIVQHCTPGNTVAFGLESADPAVRESNNLNATPEQVMASVELLNRHGAGRGVNGMPAFLPGINFVAGLEGESKETYGLNLQLLREILDRGLLLRRINIRQVSPIRRGFGGLDKKAFRRFKGAVRSEIDGPMLGRLVPDWTVLKDLYIEVRIGSVTYCRQVGSYPLLVGIPYELDTGRFIDCVVISRGYRSITGIQHPFPINTAPMSAITSLPGIGKKRAARIVRARPFEGMDGFRAAVDGSADLRDLEGAFSFATDGPV